MNLSSSSVSEISKKTSTIVLSLLLGIASALIIANLYYNDLLIPYIAQDLNITEVSVGWMMTAIKTGYLTGLIFLVPLSDKLDNKKMLIAILLLLGISSLFFSISTTPTYLIIASCFIGLSLSANQYIILYAAFISNEQNRGTITGAVTSGLMLGVVFARTFAGQMASLLSWHWVYYFSALSSLILIFTLNHYLPAKKPKNNIKLTQILKSMAVFFIKMPVLQRRSIYQALLFALFTIFWMTVPRFIRVEFNLSPNELSIFALISFVGVITASLGGYIADKGYINISTIGSIICVSLSFLIPMSAYYIGHLSITYFIIAAILMDFGFTLHLVVGQKEILQLGENIRGRLNSVYRTIFFVGGVMGSIIGTYAYSDISWLITAKVALIICIILFLYYLTELLPHKTTNIYKAQDEL
ncbi:MFS transporter [Bartonella sp. DGB1]|uniref:MFS transporter n=1 Tax=Bartonella sp. DGB1 TaxID=3239807 RepID=UPI003525D6B3